MNQLLALLRLPLRAWNELRRQLDVQILWPSCRAMALDNDRTIDTARAMFRLHASMDAAWSDLPEEEINRRIDALS